LDAGTPAGEILKSADLTMLAGHRLTDDGGFPPSDDTWSFRGSS
jgi:hypothetical protein